MSGDLTMPDELASERLSLTRWRPDHAAPTAAFMADPVAMRFFDGVASADEAWRAFAAMAGYWTLTGYGIYAVEYEGALVGEVGVQFPFSFPEIELAYSIHRPHWGKGFAPEAARVVRDEAGRRGFPALVSYIHPDNHASRRVAEKLGAIPEDTFVLNGAPSVRWRHLEPETTQTGEH